MTSSDIQASDAGLMHSVRPWPRLLAGGVAVMALVPLPVVPFVTASLVISPVLVATAGKPLRRVLPAATLLTVLSLIWLVLSQPQDFRWGLGYALIPMWLWSTAASLFVAAEVLGFRRAIFAMAVVGSSASLLLAESQSNAWKYVVGFWITIAVIALTRPQSPQRYAAYSTLIAISAVFATRNIVAILCIAAVVEFATSSGRRRPKKSSMMLILVVALGMPWILSQAALAGLFGESIAETTRMQSRDAGVLTGLLIARPEARANFQVIVDNPQGFGPGAELNREVAATMRNAFREANKDPNSEYVESYVSNRYRADLHSQVANLWFHLGVIGLLLCGWALIRYIRAVKCAVSTSDADVGLVIVCAVRGVWDLLFSPMSDLLHGSLLLAVATWVVINGPVHFKES